MNNRAAVLLSAVMTAILSVPVLADVTLVSRESTILAQAGPADGDSTTAFGLYDESASSVFQGNLSSSVTTRQRSDVTPAGISLLATATGFTQWSPRGSSSASYLNRLTVVFDVAAPTRYRFVASGGDSIPPTTSTTTLTPQGGPALWTYRGSDNAADRSGVLSPGRYTFRMNWESQSSAGAPVGGPDLVINLTFPACAADFNHDGFVDFFDYDDFVRCFESGNCPAGAAADVNGDGFVDFFDYDAFVAVFQAGC